MFLLLFLTAFSIRSQDTIVINRQFGQLRLDPLSSFWRDGEMKYDREALVALKPEFQPNEKRFLNFSYDNAFYWIQFVIENQDSFPLNLVLEIQNPHLNKLQLFYQNDSSWIDRMLTGDHYPYRQREADNPNFLYPLNIPAASITKYLLWVDKHGEQIQVPLYLWSLESFNRHNSKLHLFWGVMGGITGIFIVISLLIFGFYPNRLSLIYVIYTLFQGLFMIAHTGIGFQLLWPNMTWWQSAARPASAIIFYSTSLLFTHEFFGINKASGFLHRLIQLFIFLFASAFVCLFIHHPSFSAIVDPWYIESYYDGSILLLFLKFLSIFMPLTLILVIFIGAYFYFLERTSEALWFTLSFVFLFVGGFSVFMIFAGRLPDTIFTYHMPLLSNAFETVALAVLVAMRFNKIHHKNIQLEQEVSNQNLSIAQKLSEGQMLERRRLSQQLHDGVSADLSNIRLKLSMIAESQNPSKMELLKLVERLGETNHDIRRFSHDLSPATLHKHGLIPSIEELILLVQTSHPNLRIDFYCQGFKKIKLDKNLEENLYLIIKELIGNIVKHANATKAEIRLSYNINNSLSLLVTDNGKQYRIDDDSEGIGIKNISARITLLNGKMELINLSIGKLHQILIPVQTN